MKLVRIMLSLCMVSLLALVVSAETNEEKGTRIMKANDDRPIFQKVKTEISLNIYGSNGVMKFNKKLIMAAYGENIGTTNQVEKYMTYFMAPPDDMGNSVLAINYKGKGNEKMIYLKGIRKAKKVTGADKSLSFFGSDFNNSDVGKPDYLEWKYKYLGDTKVKFKDKEFDCMMIECTPINDATKRDLGYGRKVTYLEKKTMLTLKLEYYDTNMNKKKELRLLSFVTRNNVQGQKVYYETGIELKNVQTGTRTELIFSNFKFEEEANINPNIFSEQYLTQKWW